MRTVLFILLIAIGGIASAMPVEGTVSRIYPSGTSDKINFKLRTSDCSGSPYYSFPVNTDIGKANYSLLLAAATTGSEIVVAISSCPPAGESVQIQYIYQDFPAS